VQKTGESVRWITRINRKSQGPTAGEIPAQGGPQTRQTDRRQQGGPDDGEVPVISSNVRTVPGLISQRGCCYAGCKGVVLGPTRDIINITHGPIGCGFYSWLTRRNQTDPPHPTDTIS
jgi:nitrogenase molybdenum-iron protein alpha/beta subunit